jgi:hypothetical protein
MTVPFVFTWGVAGGWERIAWTFHASQLCVLCTDVPCFPFRGKMGRPMVSNQTSHGLHGLRPGLFSAALMEGRSCFMGDNCPSRLILVIFVGTLILIQACSAVPSKLKKTVDESITFEELRKSPDEYLGSKVLLGGKIKKVNRVGNQTDFEVAEEELGRRDIPIEKQYLTQPFGPV